MKESAMALFTRPAADVADEFAKTVERHFPGGEHIGPHVADGPWHLLAVSSQEKPNWLVVEALAGYPHAKLPAADPWTGALAVWDVYVVPKFAYELAAYWTDEYNFTVCDEIAVDPWAALPDDATLDRAAVVACLAGEDEDYNTTLAALIDVVGPAQVARRVRALVDAGDNDEAEWQQTAAAWLAAAGTPTPTTTGT